VLVRPTSVYLTHHLEAWRQVTGRAAAAAGGRVLDLPDVRAQFVPALPPGGGGTWLPAADEGVIVPSRDVRRALARSRDAASKEGLIPGMGAGWTSDAAWQKAVTSYVAPTHVPSGAAERWDPLALAASPFRMLTGPLGVGKSAVLTHAVAYARSAGWLTLFVPSAFAVMNKGLVLAKSTRRPGFVDQHDVAMAQLQALLAGQSDLLAAIPQRGTYAKFRYLPRSIDGKVSAERERLRGVEAEERNRLRAKAESEGRTWDPASYKSK
jgi:hypothetical protein